MFVPEKRNYIPKAKSHLLWSYLLFAGRNDGFPVSPSSTEVADLTGCQVWARVIGTEGAMRTGPLSSH